MPTLHGPGPGEVLPRYGPLDRVAVLSDVHGNVPALRAVLADIAAEQVDLIVSCGDLTFGPEPEATVGLMRELGQRAVFVRGNCERMLVGLAEGDVAPESDRDEWLRAVQSPASVAFLRGFAFTLVLEVRGLGPVRACHGSPRGDTEAITPATPVERFTQLMADVPEPTLISGHTHIQFDRRVDDRWRSINPGSVGHPYHSGPPGTAYWALLGPDVQLRTSRYAVEDVEAAATAAGDPQAARFVELLHEPPSAEKITEHAESVVFTE